MFPGAQECAPYGALKSAMNRAATKYLVINPRIFGSGAIHCANPQTTPCKNREKASAGEGWKRHPQRRAQSDGQDETTGMSSRARNEAGSRIRAVRRGGAISEGTARTAQAEDCKGRGQASFARSPHRRNATARAHGERNPLNANHERNPPAPATPCGGLPRPQLIKPAARFLFARFAFALHQITSTL